MKRILEFIVEQIISGNSQDAEYMSAVERGDMETAQRMVDNAAKNAGSEIPAQYHWTQADHIFNVFDIISSKEGFHFGSKRTAESRSSAFIDRNKDAQYRVFLIGDVITIEDKEINSALSIVMQLEERGETLPIERGVSTYDRVSAAEDKQRLFLSNKNDEVEVRPVPNGFGLFSQGQQVGFFSTKEKAISASKGGIAPMSSSIDRELRENVERVEKALGRTLKSPGNELTDSFDSFIVFRYLNLHEVRILRDYSYVVFNPSQIKSAEPVTYNDDGDVIPLSQRFNIKSPDIRY